VDLKDINALGQVIDTTWGRSSGLLGHSCKVSLLSDDKLTIVYSTIQTLSSREAMSVEAKRLERDAVTIIGKVVKRVCDNFNELAGRQLRIKQLQDPESSFEVTSVQPHVSAATTALFRCRCTYSVA
jgi:hypothetical protein